MVLAANRGSVVISQQVRPFAWSNFDPVTRTKVITVESGLGTLVPDSINTAGSNSIGPFLAALGLATPVSIAAAANYAIYVPFSVTIPVTAYKMFYIKGGTISGNVDMAIYDESLARLVTTGSTAVSAGTNAHQVVDIANTELDTGRYYMGIALSSATGTYYTWPASGVFSKALGVNEEAAAFPLPATATFIADPVRTIPLVGISIRSTF